MDDSAHSGSLLRGSALVDVVAPGRAIESRRVSGPDVAWRGPAVARVMGAACSRAKSRRSCGERALFLRVLAMIAGAALAAAKRLNRAAWCVGALDASLRGARWLSVDRRLIERAGVVVIARRRARAMRRCARHLVWKTPSGCGMRRYVVEYGARTSAEFAQAMASLVPIPPLVVADGVQLEVGCTLARPRQADK